MDDQDARRQPGRALRTYVDDHEWSAADPGGMRPTMKRVVAVAIAVCAAASGVAARQDKNILSVDHTVTVKSQVPAIAGQDARIYVRERLQEGLKPAADRVVLFVHGAGTPAEVAFDVPTGDYSWMAFLAKNGFDTFSMDTEGHGRSSRPALMSDPCNLSAEQQK